VRTSPTTPVERATTSTRPLRTVRLVVTP
jgi:hypothetical protein